VRGEDYNFHFSGRVREGKLHFRLHMEYEGDDPAQAAPRSRRTIDFVCVAFLAWVRVGSRCEGNEPAHAGPRSRRTVTFCVRPALLRLRVKVGV